MSSQLQDGRSRDGSATAQEGLQPWLEVAAAEEVVVVMVPFPAQGHLNQLLHLSRLLSSRGLPVHYVGSATHNRQAKSRVHGWDPLSATTPNATPIHFHDFPDLPPDLPLLPPNPDAPTKFPTHLLPLFLSTESHLRPPFSALLRHLSTTARRVIVIHDSLTSFASYEASLLANVEAYCFYACSAFTLVYPYYQFHQFLSTENNHKNDSTNKNVSYNNIIPKELLSLVSMKDCFAEELSGMFGRCTEFNKLASGYLCNTCQPIDGRYLEYFRILQSERGSDKYWAVGPLNPISPTPTTPRHACLDWLDQQPTDSVLYISFGTMTSVSDEQITELALGLEQSGQRFIWVVRDADGGDIYTKNNKRRIINLPDGFEERVKERGVVEREWAPQLEILAHPSTGGFVSHCGWNSCVESLSMGVPIGAWPMHSDQPMNTILVTEVLKVGLVARDWADREGVVKAESVEKVVKRLMVEEEGRVLRKRARELGLAVRGDLKKGGSSTGDFDSFLDYICRSGEEISGDRKPNLGMVGEHNEGLENSVTRIDSTQQS